MESNFRSWTLISETPRAPIMLVLYPCPGKLVFLESYALGCFTNSCSPGRCEQISEVFERKKEVFFKTCFHTRSMSQTIFSDEYYLWETRKTKNPGAPTTGTTTSIRSNSVKFGFFGPKVGNASHRHPWWFRG